MKWSKRLFALVLAGAMSLSPALGAAVEERFPAVDNYDYANYADVPAGAWYADAARVCFETGMMTGTGSGFSPQGTVTVGECVAVAARMRAALTGGEIPPGVVGEPWYQCYIDYFLELEDGSDQDFLGPQGSGLLTRPLAAATRSDFLCLLGLAVGDQEVLTPINAISTLPDTDNSVVLAFYNAGILTGVDGSGTFYGAGTLSRSEAAAMIARVVRPALRQTFIPQNPAQTPSQNPAQQPDPPSAAPTYEEELAATPALTVNGQQVSMERFAGWLNQVVEEADKSLQAQGVSLDWNAKYAGIPDLPAYFKNLAMERAAVYVLKQQKANQMGCTIGQLAAAITPNPSEEELGRYVELLGLMASKHILIQTVDSATQQTIRSDGAALALAQSVIDALDQSPTLDTFDRLMEQYGEDPGMRRYPDGYVFGSGEMVKEYEEGTKALEWGQYSPAPVKSSFGYHVIWRLNPYPLPDLDQAAVRAGYQSSMLEIMVNTWLSQATVTPNQALIDSIQVPATYRAYLEKKQQQ